MFEKFQEVANDRHAYARRWKEKTGRKVLGFFCCYMPEEIVYAAGMLPVRIVDSHDLQDFTDQYFQTWSRNCPFSRGCFAEGLKGAYDYLDGIIMPRTCVHVLHAYDAWKARIPMDFTYFIYVPSIMNAWGVQDNFVGELRDFRSALGEWAGVTITDQDLLRGIEIMDESRRLLRQMYEMRKSTAPPLSGAETMEVVLSSMFSDKTEHNVLLSNLVDQLPTRPDKPEPGVRLMMVGGELDQPELLRLIESRGATIVADDLCMGSRYFWNQSEPKDDPLTTIAARFIAKPSCPVKDVTQRRRLPHIMQMARDYDVQGVIMTQQKLCDPHEQDLPVIQKMLRQHNLPSLHIELESTIAVGQLRTRVEAFLEMLQLDLV